MVFRPEEVKPACLVEAVPCIEFYEPFRLGLYQLAHTSLMAIIYPDCSPQEREA